MHWIDGHLDLAYIALRGRDLRMHTTDAAAGCVSLPALREAGVDLAFATIFTEPVEGNATQPGAYPVHDAPRAEQAGRRQLALYERLEREGELSIVHARSDLDDTSSKPKVVLLMEGADPIGSPEGVSSWHAAGLRMVGLTWSRGTRYAGGNATPGGLTPAGIELVRTLDQHGIVHDASHLADDAFDDLFEHATGRIVATHSNCRALMDGANQRHLRDDQIRAIGERDGIVGLNLFTKFLRIDGRATIDDCTAHVEHICELMGHRHGVTLGSDMDGGFGPEGLPVGLDHPQKLDRLAEALQRRGWSDADIAGFAHGNWRRLLEETLPDQRG